MVDFNHQDLFLRDNVAKQFHIVSDDGLINITNTELHQEKLEITESLCSESELRFGSCESSVLKFTVSNVFLPMKDKWLTVTVELEGTAEPFQYGRYKVFSDIPTADRSFRDVTAYDAMYDIINSSAINWYNKILPNNDSKVTMRDFRTSFCKNFGITQKEITLANDDMIVEKTIQVGEDVNIDTEQEKVSVLRESSLSGLNVISAICEINGCFAHIGRNGKLHYIYLQQNIQGIYPADFLYPDHVPEKWNYLPQAETGHLYPQDPKTNEIGKSFYISADYEDYVCRKIGKVQIRQKENDIGAQYPPGEVLTKNYYIIEDNFLVYGKGAEDLNRIAKNVFDKITDIVYRPFSADCVGNPCLEVGDPVRLSTKYEIIESYILKRTLKGIQALRDDISANGEEYRTEKVNSVSQSIIQLKGKTNTLERNVEKTVSIIEDLETNTNTRFEQTSDAIEAEASARNEMGKEIKANLSLKIDKDDDGTIVSLINGTADKIHFGANNMFTVDAPNFSVDADGNIFLNGGISLSFLVNARPPYYSSFKAIEAGTDAGGLPYLYMYSPSGKRILEAGNIVFGQKPNSDQPYDVDTPIFNNGIYAENAVIASLYQDYKEFNSVSNGIDTVDLRVRRSGQFVCAYGAYHTYNHPAGESKNIIIGNEASHFLPKHHSVRTCGYYGKRAFVFGIDESGIFFARNASESNVNITATDSDPTPQPTDIQFRFDYFLM